jgi:hypothetical protein
VDGYGPSADAVKNQFIVSVESIQKKAIS